MQSKKEIPPDIASLDILYARQPILDIEHKLYGFELLYRGKTFDVTKDQDGIGATGELLSNLCSIALDSTKANTKPSLFINIDRHFIESPSFYPNQSDNIVLEILETVPATPDILATIRKLRTLGFSFALDDFAFEDHRLAFLPYVTIIKVDVLACPPSQVRDLLPKITGHKVTLLAEKVESMEMYNQCVDAGFTLFQGYYLERPSSVQGVKIAANKEVTLKLLSEITRPDITVKELADLIACDPRLAVKLMLLVNSSLYSFVKEVVDFKEAVVMLGIEAVKRWAMILLLVAESTSPKELLRILLARAKTLELYASENNNDTEGELFTLGLYSGIEALLGIHIKNIVNYLPMSAQMAQALTDESGEYGDILRIAKKVEAFDTDVSTVESNSFIKINSNYWQGLQWADELMETLEA
ncbi:HDOD domain-containing protein [Alteromonas sp. KUL49]|uniref:EAL and HDOD domain-containing protein n=1 Tax=Alteromonas sp. KUL49 TaxID=2480798 RepID=UPI00102EE013|nr:HDOD domain-containing protein [Alteromonas sp. KUL49]TAP37944.1 HDOD domain-containing protein [Alteromonas sp. KUL49]GEA12809.1 histidine kinase [Alteromonas sp. KUL49]